MKIRTGCQYVGYFYYSEHLNWAAQNLRLGRGLDIADLDLCIDFILLQASSVFAFEMFSLTAKLLAHPCSQSRGCHFKMHITCTILIGKNICS